MDESVDTDFDNPAVILFNEDYTYFIGTWDAAFEANSQILFVRPTQIATAGVPGGDPQSDAVFFGGLMPFTQDTDVDYYSPAANTWTDTNITLTANGQHQAVNFVSLSALAIADVNTVKLYQTPLTATPTLITTLTIGTDFEITSMCYFNQNLYIGTQNVYGGHAYMYVWNGLGTAANAVYEVDSNMIFSVCAYKTYVMLLTGNGSLLKFNGGGLELAAGFPIFYTDQALIDETNIGMYKNIMKSNGNLLYILFSNQDNDSNRLLDMPDGLWCYDENVGLYHRYSLSIALVQQETISTANVNTTTNQITVTNSYFTGTEVYYNNGGGTSIAGLTSNTKYYVIRVDSTHIQLASTPALATAGTAIDLTGTGNNLQKFVFYPDVDYGAFYNDRTFSLNVIERPVDNRQYGTDVMWGAEVIRRDNTANYAVLGVPAYDVSARGYFITPKVFSTDVIDTLNLVTLKFSKFVSPTDKIIIKYRTYDDMKEFINLSDWAITWTSGTTFTATGTGWATAAVGNEVEVLNGAAGGLLAHITAISEAGGTYTVTIDETYSNYVSGDISKAIFRNWIKWKTITYGDSNAEKYFISEQLGANGKFIQLKVELRGVRTTIEELLIDNKYRLPKQSK